MLEIFKRVARPVARALLAKLDIERYYEVRDKNVRISGVEYPIFKNRVRTVCVGSFSKDKFRLDHHTDADFLTVAILEVHNDRSGTKDADLVYLSGDVLGAIFKAYSIDKPADMRDGGSALNDVFDDDIQDGEEMIIAHQNAFSLVKAANAYMQLKGSQRQAAVANTTVVLSFTDPEV
ncbi:MAG: hypothetical protein ACRBCT_02510 [Alphaproteobacteria bacterium]